MTFDTAPTLHTHRLTLRPHRENDLNDCVALWNDPIVTQHTSGTAISKQDVWTRLLRHPGHWALLGFGYWVVCERVSGKFVGEVGIADFKRSVVASLSELESMPEAGWVLMPWAHGQGYATEAIRVVLEWRDEHLPKNGTFCLIASKNLASLKVAEKVGFQLHTTLQDNSKDLRVLLRP
jgi:RimJ/RimL family protein N-acetyltransferase